MYGALGFSGAPQTTSVLLGLASKANLQILATHGADQEFLQVLQTRCSTFCNSDA